MTALRRSSIRNAGASPFYAPYRGEGGEGVEREKNLCCSPPPPLPQGRQGSGYFHCSSLRRGFSSSGPCDLSSSPSVRGTLAVLGGILVHICLGTVYTWGTLAVYVISYMRLLQEEQNKLAHLSAAGQAATPDTVGEQIVGRDRTFEQFHPDSSTADDAAYYRTGVATVRLSDAAWIVACQFAGMAIAMPLGGKIERKIGPCKTVLAGGAVMCAAVAAAPYVLHNYLLFLACYGLTQGIGLGLAYTAPLVCGLTWFPHRKGVISGAITAGFGTGALLFSPLQAAFLNPLNIPPSFAPYPSHPAELYYDPSEAEERAVLLRIPPLLQRLAVAYMLLLGIGAALLQPRTLRRSRSSRGTGESSSSSTTAGKDENAMFAQPLQAPGDLAGAGETAAIDRGSERGLAIPAAAASHEDIGVENRVEKLQVWAVLRGRPFWSLWSLFFLNGLAICFTASFWRFMAIDEASRTYVLTEAQLAIVGAAASACNAAGRIGWGQVVDSKGFKTALTLLSALWSGLLLYLPNATRHGGLAYAATVCGSFFCLGGNFAVFPSAVAAIYGEGAIGHLYGYVFSSQLASSLSFAFLTQRVVQALGTDGLCTLMGLCCIVSAGATCFLPFSCSPQTKNKKDFPRVA